jgi:hypothetical protein
MFIFNILEDKNWWESEEIGIFMIFLGFFYGMSE